jgi:hypothetical protein
LGVARDHGATVRQTRVATSIARRSAGSVTDTT